MKTIIVGKGQIGQSLGQVLEKVYEVSYFDVFLFSEIE